MMQRLIPITGACTALGAVAILAASLVGCDKSKEEDCTKAVANIRLIYGTDLEVGPSPRAAVRSCRGSTSAARVDCYIAAKTREELQQCGGELIPQAPPSSGDKPPTVQDGKPKPDKPDVTPDNTPKPPTLIDPKDPATADPTQDTPGQGEPSKGEPAKTEPGKSEPGKSETIKAEPSKSEPIKAPPFKTQPAKVPPAKPDPGKLGPAKPSPGKPAANPAPQPSKSAPGQ